MGESNTRMATGATFVAESAGDLVAGARPELRATQGPEPVAESSLVGVLLLERYRIIERLGAGGMGVVYLAEHVTIRKRCAIKVLSDEYANKPDIVDRFLQEARAASMIAHENVVEITDYGQTPSGSVFFVMEMLQGEDLAATLRREGALPWARVKPILLQICHALHAAHDKGIIHRDMKPENCFRIERGGTKDFIKVLDFGIAKVTSEEGDGGKGLTKTGMIFGTPEYMSPEQAQGLRVDHRADIYAVGVIMYELLTGQVPFTADTFMGVLTKHMWEVPPSPSAVAPEGVKIPREVEALILKSLQKDPDHRFASMAEMIDAIDGTARGRAVAVVHERMARPPSGPLLAFSGGEASRAGAGAWIAAIVAVLVGAAIAAFALFDGGDDRDGGEAGDGVAGAAVAPADAPEPSITPVVPEPPTPPEPATPTVVKLLLGTNVEAEVYDPEGDAVLGRTNHPEGIAVAREAAPRQLVLRADGYEDQRIEVIPDRDLEQTYELTVKAKTKRSPGTGTGSKVGKQSKSGDEDKPTPQGGGDGGKGSLGLKNPFGGLGK